MENTNDIRYIPKEKGFLTITNLQANLMAEFPDDEMKIDSVSFISSKISTLGGELASYNFIKLKQDAFNLISKGPEKTKYLKEDILSASNISDLMEISNELDGSFKDKYKRVLYNFGQEIISLKKQIGNCYNSLNDLFEELEDNKRFDIGKKEVLQKDGSVEIEYDYEKVGDLANNHIQESFKSVINYEKQMHGVYVQLDKLNIDGDVSEKITQVNNPVYNQKLENLVETSNNLQFAQERVCIWVASQNLEAQKDAIDKYFEALSDYKEAMDDIVKDKVCLAIIIKQAERIRDEEASKRVITPEEKRYMEVLKTVYAASKEFSDEECFVKARSILEKTKIEEKIKTEEKSNSFDLDF